MTPGRANVTGKPEVLDDRRCLLGEGPAFDAARNRLWWVDILSHRILWRDLNNGTTGDLPTGDLIGAVILRQDGGLTACLSDRIVTIDPDSQAVLETIMMPTGHTQAAVSLRMNDAKCAPDGQLFAGSMFVDEIPGSESASALYRVKAGSIHGVLSGVTLSNGLAWSPGGQIMYYVDTRTQRIDQFDYEADSGPRNRRPLVVIDPIDGNPDGICADLQGGIWVALWAGAKVHRYDAMGRLTHVVPLPVTQPTSVAFYGHDLRSLAITSAAIGTESDDKWAGQTFTVEPGVAGCAVAAFAG